MNQDAITQRNLSMDSAKVAEIAREVIAQLAKSSSKVVSNSQDTSDSEATSSTRATATVIDAKVITAQIIESISGTPEKAFVLPSAVITPAAKDAARHRGMTLERTIDLPADQRPHPSQIEIIDYADPERADAIRQQVARRGITSGTAKVVLSETPAKEVYFQCAKQQQVAVMITSIADIVRFADEVSPTVWVLDMQKLNFTATVNAVAQIIQTEKADR
ncbi:MAG: hypothetical protein ACR2NZ_10525 [Rubripirellula sp.]